MADYKKTLNLPQTAFPMKANLPATEPAMIARWESIGLYEKMRADVEQAREYFAAGAGTAR